MFVYDQSSWDLAEHILLGLWRKGLLEAFSIHSQMVREVEDEAFNIINELRAEAQDSPIRAARRLYRQIPENQQASLRPTLPGLEALFDSNPSAVAAFIDELLTRVEASFREGSHEVVVPIPLVLAIDLLYQTSIVRMRLYDAANSRLSEAFDRRLVFGSHIGGAVELVESPADPSVFQSFGPLVEYVNGVLRQARRSRDQGAVETLSSAIETRLTQAAVSTASRWSLVRWP